MDQVKVPDQAMRTSWLACISSLIEEVFQPWEHLYSPRGPSLSTSSYRKALATSHHPWAIRLRALRSAVRGFTLPAPKAVTVPYRMAYTGVRGVVHAVRRVLIAEPIFKSYCTVVGKRVRTGVFVHWVMGRGRIILGDDVLLDGKISFSFAARFVDMPTLRIGDRTDIGHGCAIIVGEAVTIGSDCRIASGVQIRDSPGHPVEPEARRRGEPPPRSAVRPITIEDNVWIGSQAIVQAGVTIGQGSVVSSGAVVMNDVPPYSLVAGNPARRIGIVTAATPTIPEGS